MAIPANFSDLNTRDDILALWYIEVEGLRERYGGPGLPSWNPADTGTNRPIKDYLHAIPLIQGQKAKPLNGSCTPHSFTIELLDVDDLLTALFSIHDDTNAAGTLMTDDITAAGVTLTVGDSSVFSLPCDIYVDRETMRATATAVPPGTILTVTRGMYGSEAVAHKVTDKHGNDREVQVWDKPRFIVTRGVTLYESRQGLLEADGIKLCGFLDDIGENNGVYSLECSGLLKRLSAEIGLALGRSALVLHLHGPGEKPGDIPGYGWLDIGPGGWTLYGQKKYLTWCMDVGDADIFQSTGWVKVDDELIRYEGKSDPGGSHLHIDSAFDDKHVSEKVETYKNRGMLYWDIFEQVTVGSPSWTSLLGLDISPWTTWHAPGAEVHECFTHEAIWGADNVTAVDPISVVLQILLSKLGDGANHGTYDVLPEGWGLGLDASLVDVTGMEALRDSLGVGSLDLKFCIDKAVSAKKWMEENLLRSALLFFVEKWDGTIGLDRLYSRPEAEKRGADLAIDEDMLLEIPKYKPGKPPMGQFFIKINYYPPEDKHYGVVNVVMGDVMEKLLGVARTFEIECKTIYDNRIGTSGRSWQANSPGSLPEFLANYLGPMYDRFALYPAPVLEVSIPYNRLTDVQVGSVVTLTSSVTPNVKTSARGMNAVWFQVIEAHPEPARAAVRLVLWMIDVHDSAYRQIAPSAKVLSYAAVGPRGFPCITLYDTTFSKTGVKDYIWFKAWHKIVLLNSKYEELTPAEVMEIKGVGDSYIDLVAAPTAPPGDGDFVDTAPYDSCAAAQQDDWSFQAGADDKLGGASDEGHVRL